MITKRASRALRILVFSSLGCATFFGLLSLTLHFGDWDRLLIVTTFGLFFGFLAAPELEPSAFKYPWLLQGACGVVSAALLGIFLELTQSQIIGVSIAGGILGLLAPFWIKHAPAP